jgi:hypothetical protein
VCATHVRSTTRGPTCVDCLRQVLKDRGQRGYFAHLAEDPYFFWYFDGQDWFDAYDQYDYALFDPSAAADWGDGGANLDGGAWEGS